MYLRDIFNSASAHAGKLAVLEFELLKGETNEAASRLVTVIIYGAIACVFCFFGFAFLLISLAYFLTTLGLAAWVATGIIAVIGLAVGGLCAFIAKSKLGDLSVIPHRTIMQFKRDVEVLYRSLTDV